MQVSEGMLQLLQQELTRNAVAPEYPQCTLTVTAACSSYSGTVLYETYTSRFFLTGFVGLILRSTAVASASRSTIEGTMRVLCMCSSLSAFCHSSVRVPL